MGLRGCHLESKAMISPADFLIDAGVQYGSVAQEQIVDSRNDNENNVIRGMFHGFSRFEFLVYRSTYGQTMQISFFFCKASCRVPPFQLSHSRKIGIKWRLEVKKLKILAVLHLSF